MKRFIINTLISLGIDKLFEFILQEKKSSDKIDFIIMRYELGHITKPRCKELVCNEIDRI